MSDEAITKRGITPKFRSSYVRLFEPRVQKSGKKQYQVVGLFPEKPELPPGSITLDAMKKIAVAVALEKFGSTDEVKKKIKLGLEGKTGGIRMPFRENDGKFPDEYPVYVTFSANEEFKPGVVDRVAGADGRPKTITDPGQVYSGCWGRVSFTAFAYDNEGNKGVSFGLNNFQKLGDDKRLDNRQAAEDAFGALDEAGADTASLEGMLDEE